MSKRNVQGSGPGGHCICPKCGEKVEHVAGQRCLETRCPKCGSAMVRDGSVHHQQIQDLNKGKPA